MAKFVVPSTEVRFELSETITISKSRKSSFLWSVERVPSKLDIKQIMVWDKGQDRIDTNCAEK
jgi:hypothetical protein